MEEKIVSKELACLLKENGFQEPIWTLYNEDGDLIWLNLEEHAGYCNDDDDWTSAPTLNQAQQWLREEYKVHILIGIMDGDWVSQPGSFDYEDDDDKEDMQINEFDWVTVGNSYEDVQEKGIIRVLKEDTYLWKN